MCTTVYLHVCWALLNSSISMLHVLMLQFTYTSRETARYQIRIQAHELTLQEFIFMYMYLNLILKFIICVLLYFTVSVAKWLPLQNSVSKGGCTSGIMAMHFSWRPAEQVNFIVFNTCTCTNTALCLTLSYCAPGGGGGALISKIHIFAMNTTAMTFGDYS